MNVEYGILGNYEFDEGLVEYNCIVIGKVFVLDFNINNIMKLYLYEVVK